MTTLNAPLASRILTPAVEGYVSEFVSRKRRFVLLKAVGLSLAFTLVWMLLWCLADRFLHLPSFVRLALLAINIVVVLMLMFRPVIVALRRRIDWIDATAEIEAHNPRFTERLQTITSQLLAPPELRGSRDILDQLVREVDRQAVDERAEELIPLKLIARPWLIAFASIVLLVAMLPISWIDLPRLMMRYFMPLANIAPVTTTRLAVTPGPADVIQGEPLPVTVIAQRLGDSAVTLHVAPADGDAQTWAASSMIPAGDNKFTFSVASVDRDLRYYVSGGDAMSPTYPVRVLRRPAVAEFRIKYVYPEYTGRAPLTVSNTDGLIEAPVGTTAEISVVATEPLESATLVVGPETLFTQATIDPNVRTAKLTVSKDYDYQLHMTSTRLVSGGGPSGMVIRAVPDRAPLVRVLQPNDDLRLHPRDILPIVYQAMDDYGIEKLSISVQSNASAAKEQPVRIRGDARRQESVFHLDLAQFELKIGDVVTFTMTAQDRAGQKSTSEPRHLLIAPRSIDVNAHMRIAELRQASQLAENLVTELEESTKALEAARQAKNAAEMQYISAFSTLNQRLAGASETAALARLSLGRAIMRSPSNEFATAMSQLIDTAEVQASTSEDVLGLLGATTAQTDAPRARLAQALEQAKQFNQQLKVLAHGEQAAALLADRANLVASEKAVADQKDKAAAERLAPTLQRAKEDIAASATELGLNPAAGDLDAHLTNRVAAADQFAKSQRPVDFATIGKQWADNLGKPDAPRSIYDQRLAAAAQAEAVRPDADLVRARDMQLAGRAAATVQAAATSSPAATTQPVVTEPKAEFSAAMAAMQAEHDMNRRPATDVRTPDQIKAVRTASAQARSKLIKWSGGSEAAVAAATQPSTPSPAGAETEAMAAMDRSSEELAMEANAAAQEKDYEKAKALDEALSKKIAQESSQTEYNLLANNQQQSQTSGDQKSQEAQAQQDAAKQAQAGMPEKQQGTKFDTKNERGQQQQQQQQQGEQQQAQTSENAEAAQATAAERAAQREKQRQQLAQAMDKASDIDKIVAAQEKLKADTQAIKPTEPTKQPDQEKAQALAERQKEIAERIEAVEEEEDMFWDEEPWDADPDSREEMAATIMAAQQQLAAMPQELTEAQQAATAQREAAARAKQAKDAETAATNAMQAPTQASNAANEASKKAADQAQTARDAASAAASKAADAQKAATDAAPDKAAAAQQAAAQAAQAQAAAAQAAAAEATKADTAAKQAEQAQATANKAAEARDAAKRTADEAQRQLDEANKNLADQSKPIAPAVGELLSGALAKFSPETQTAQAAVDQKLLPALRALEKAQQESNAGQIDAQTAQARQAIDAVQAELRKSQDALVERDPLVAARAFAEAAADALQRQPPDLAAAQGYQTSTSAALSRAWDNSIHQAAGMRMATLPAMSSIMANSDAAMFEINGKGAGTGAVMSSIPNVPGLREWGRFRSREPEGLNASVHESDPPEYQESLKIYFEELGKSRVEPKK